MTKTLNRSFSVVMSFLLILAIIFSANLHTTAATVDYVKYGKYIYNWGVREQVATFLSPNAENFYQNNNITFSELSSHSGSSNLGGVPTSELYKELQNLMAKNHTYNTSYGDTRNLFQYTDCQNSGRTSKRISSFYSGVEVGPQWDTGKTWNREHTWPKSKTDYKSVDNGDVNEATDIMSLRPTASSENTSRSNKAYGKVTNASYFYPNNYAGDKYDLRGDCARIMLYVYVRWGNTTNMWGSYGVIESKSVLLEWMQADPVDTWELGRNDSVQSITGTRNVFVDYPELAFLLFGEQIPANYQTPSGIANNGAVIVPTPDNNGNQNDSQNNSQGNNQNNSQDNSTNQTENDYQSNPRDEYQVPAYDLDYCSHKNAVKVEAENPRCDTEGFTEGTYCPDCKEYINGHQLVEATGHTYSGNCDADCNACGSLREISKDITHNIENGVCAVCGIENTDESTSEEQEVNTNLDEKNKPKRSFTWIIIVGGVLIVGTGAVLVYIYRDKIWPKETE